MARQLQTICLLVAALALLCLCGLQCPAQARLPEPVYGGIPLASGPVGALSTASFVVLPSSAFVIGYSDTRMNPLWACYRVYGTTQSGSAKSCSWKTDPRTSAQIADGDYAHTLGDYDRGHMVPKAAMYRCYGQAAVAETYVLSNACPQLHRFNDRIWGDLEDLVREEYSQMYDEVWVTVGPIFDDTNGRACLTKDAEHAALEQKPIEIPDAFYAILVDVEDTTPRALAFIMAHEECSTSGATRRDRLAPFLRSIDEIEQRTGLDFMWLLDDQAEQQLETTAATAMW